MEEPNLHVLPAWREVGVGGSRKSLECEEGRGWRVENYLTAPECMQQTPWTEGDGQRQLPFSCTQFYQGPEQRGFSTHPPQLNRSQDSPGKGTRGVLRVRALGRGPWASQAVGSEARPGESFSPRGPTSQGLKR